MLQRHPLPSEVARVEILPQRRAWERAAEPFLKLALPEVAAGVFLPALHLEAAGVFPLAGWPREAAAVVCSLEALVVRTRPLDPHWAPWSTWVAAFGDPARAARPRSGPEPAPMDLVQLQPG